MNILTGGFNMGRLFYQRADAIINQKVLDHFALNVNPQRDIGNLDKITAYAIMRGMEFVVVQMHPQASKASVVQFVSCVMQSIMHIEPKILPEMISKQASLAIWDEIVDSMRAKLIAHYVGRHLTNEEIYAIIVKQVLLDLESRFFR